MTIPNGRRSNPCSGPRCFSHLSPNQRAVALHTPTGSIGGSLTPLLMRTMCSSLWPSGVSRMFLRFEPFNRIGIDGVFPLRGRYWNGGIILEHGLHKVWVVKALPGCQTSIRIVLEQVRNAFDQFQRDGLVEKGMYVLRLDLRIGQCHAERSDGTEENMPLGTRSQRPLQT